MELLLHDLLCSEVQATIQKEIPCIRGCRAWSLSHALLLPDDSDEPSCRGCGGVDGSPQKFQSP